MEPEKKEHKYLTVLITVLVMLLVTAAAVAGVWYYMYQQAKKTADDNAAQVAALQKQIDDLNKTIAAKSTTTTTAPSTTTTTTSELDSLRTFCIAGNSDTVVADLVYDSNQNGIYGGCGISSKSQPGGGAFLIAKKVNGTWTKIWTGNGSVDKALITQYKIPVYIYPHQLLDN